VVSTSVLPFSIIVVLPDDGHNYRPKHVVVFMTNKWTCILLVSYYSKNQ